MFVVDEVANELIETMVQEGAMLIKGDKIKALQELITYEDQEGAHVRKEWVGKDAHTYLDALNISYDQNQSALFVKQHLNIHLYNWSY